MTEPRTMPPLAEFIVRTPLYQPYQIDDYTQVLTLEFGSWSVDAYCPGCGDSTVYRSVPAPLPDKMDFATLCSKTFADAILTFSLRPWPPLESVRVVRTTTKNYALAERYFATHCACTRGDLEHGVVAHFLITARQIQKIGQFPSSASLLDVEARKYRPLLKDRAQEFARAKISASHSFGIAAFAYLRRVFEEEIEVAHALARGNEGWDESTYKAARMAERVSLLRDQLPPFVVENGALYGILSDGLHNWTEEECLATFGLLETGIELILDSRLAAHQRAAMEKRAKAELEDLRRRQSMKPDAGQ